MQALDDFFDEEAKVPSVLFKPSMSDLEIETLVKVYSWSANIVVFSKADCKFCQRAIRLLNTLMPMIDVKCTIKIIDLNSTDAAIVQPVLKRLTGQTTVPNIFFNREHVGGYDKLCEYLQGVMQRIDLLNTQTIS
jgi:glutaredoxin 3